jgi:hypothetical protein
MAACSNSNDMVNMENNNKIVLSGFPIPGGQAYKVQSFLRLDGVEIIADKKIIEKLEEANNAK